MPVQRRKRYRVTEYLPYKVARYAGQVAAYHYGGPTGAYAYDKIMPSVGTQTGVGYHSYGNGTLTTERHKYGRKRRKNARYLNRLVRANITRRIYGYNAWSQMYGVSGYNRLENYYKTGGTANYYVPCHLYDVTTAINYVSGSTQYPQVGYRLGFTNPASGTMAWRTLGPTLTEQQNDLNSANPSGNPLSNDMLTGVKAKIVAYCPTTIPVRFKIAFVQISDQKYQPSKNPVGASGINDYGIWNVDNTLLPNDMGTSLSNVAAEWQAFIQQYVRSPCATSDSNVKRNFIRVLKSTSFILQPKETTDPANTTYHHVSLYYPMARKQNYMWEDDSIMNLATDNSVQTNVGLNKCCVHPNARIYLLVMADAKYNTGPDDPVNDPTIWPSYDISMRFYHEDLR